MIIKPYARISFAITLTMEEAMHLAEIAKSHYDASCRKFGESIQKEIRWITEIEMEHEGISFRADDRDYQLALKTLEMAAYHDKKELGVHLMTHMHAAYRQARQELEAIQMTEYAKEFKCEKS